MHIDIEVTSLHKTLKVGKEDRKNNLKALQPLNNDTTK